MPRLPREWIAGGVYHVLCRGSNRQAIFKHDTDRIDLLDCAAVVVQRHRIECLAFGLMPNHCHWLFRIPADDDRLSIAMKELNGRYSLRFNHRYDREAHLFRNRFRAVPQQTHEQFLWTVRYIVRNPVRARICEQPGQWRWSSYNAIAGRAPAATFLCTDELLRTFAPTRRRAQERYRDFVAGGADDDLLSEVRGERLGDKAFLRVRHADDELLPEIPRVQLEPLRRSLEEIFASSSEPVAVAYRDRDYSLREIGAHLGCHYSTVSRRLRREEGMLQCKT